MRRAVLLAVCVALASCPPSTAGAHPRTPGAGRLGGLLPRPALHAGTAHRRPRHRLRHSRRSRAIPTKRRSAGPSSRWRRTWKAAGATMADVVELQSFHVAADHDDFRRARRAGAEGPPRVLQGPLPGVDRGRHHRAVLEGRADGDPCRGDHRLGSRVPRPTSPSRRSPSADKTPLRATATAPLQSGHPRADPHVDARHAGTEQGRGGGVDGRARGHDVVDQGDVRRAVRSLRHRERTAQVAPAVGGIESRLRGRGAHPAQQVVAQAAVPSRRARGRASSRAWS